MADAVTASIELRGSDGSPVRVLVDVQGNVATFDPEIDLALLDTYTAVVNTSVTDLAGNALPLAQTWKLTVRDVDWRERELIENNNAARSFRQQIAMDDAGNAIAGKAWLTWGSRNGDFRRDIDATPFR